MEKIYGNIRLGFCVLLLSFTTQLTAQEEPEELGGLFEQMEKMLQEFGQGSFFQMDSMMMQDFEFPSEFNRDSLGMGSMDFPQFFFSDTLSMDSTNPMSGFGLDMQGLMDELSRSFESMDPADMEGMEELLRQFKSNGIAPDDQYLLPEKNGKKKKKIYKI